MSVSEFWDPRSLKTSKVDEREEGSSRYKRMTNIVRANAGCFIGS
jgi:hypothetical protein